MLFSRDLPLTVRRGDLAAGVRVLVLAQDEDSPVVEELTQMGALVEIETELYGAISAMLDDPLGYRICVVDCRSSYWYECRDKILRTLAAEGLRVRAIFCNAPIEVSDFPGDLNQPIRLGSDLSDSSLTIAVRHILRDREVWLEGLASNPIGNQGYER